MSENVTSANPEVSEQLAAQMEFYENLQKASGLWMEIVSALKQEPPKDIPLDPFNVMESFANSWLNFWREPEKAMTKQMEFWSGLQEIWTQTLSGKGEGAPQGKDRRFSHAAWKENMAFAYLRSNYLFMHKWMEEVVDSIEDVSEHEKIVTGLSLRNIIEALNPANFAMSNPEVIEATIAENGANLVRGLTMMKEDIERGHGQLLIRQVDYSAFEVGRNIAVTEGKVIFETDQFQLIQYAPRTKTVNQIPVMFIPPWINKFYVLDLNEKKSFAKWLSEQGYTVFMVSWYNADESSKEITWDKRLEALREAMGVVCKECNAPQTHVISFCIGGTMTGSLLAELSRKKDDIVASTTFLTAQFDFEHAGELMAYVSEKSVKMLDDFEEQGFIPAEAMSSGFNLLRSNDLIWSYIVNNYLLGKTPMAFDLLYWNSDSMRMPVKVQKYYLDEFYLKNAFMRDALPIGDHKVGVSDIRVPTYHLAAIEDHIAPAASVYIAAQAMKNADVRYVLAGSGHIAGVVNPPAQEKYHYWRNDSLKPATLDEWRQGATQHPGSWWLDWIEWLKGFGGEQVPARVPGAVHKPIEDAPGRYVKMRFDAA